MGTTIRNSKLFCDKCGQEQTIPYPIAIPMMTAMTGAFGEMHKNCKGTWVQPEIEQTKSLNEKMMFWLSQGERGTSSETMFQKLSGQNLRAYNSHPCDPDDFRRCYLLLKTIPEWKAELFKLKGLSPVWSKLIDNWDKLTEMLEEQMKTHKANGMYELMKSLGC